MYQIKEVEMHIICYWHAPNMTNLGAWLYFKKGKVKCNWQKPRIFILFYFILNVGGPRKHQEHYITRQISTGKNGYFIFIKLCL